MSQLKADPEIYFGGQTNLTKFFNRKLRVKPESSAKRLIIEGEPGTEGEVQAMAYLGFHKGGPNFLWPLVLTERGGQTRFSKFFPM